MLARRAPSGQASWSSACAVQCASVWTRSAAIHQSSRRDIGVRPPAPGRSRVRGRTRNQSRNQPNAAPCARAFPVRSFHELEGVVGVPIAAAMREAVVPDGGVVDPGLPDAFTASTGVDEPGALLALVGDADLNVGVTVARCREVRTARVGDEPVDLAYSPDGSRLAVGGSEGYVSVLDTATGRRVHRSTKLFSSFVGDVEWLPDGGTVVASGDDDVAAMYDVDRDIVRAGSMPATDTLVNGYAYLMPGPADEVIVLDGQHPGHRYPLDPSRWLARACQIAGRDLTPAEWNRYVPTEPYRPTCSGLMPG